jgi:UDP-glucuronate 4-epimerase
LFGAATVRILRPAPYRVYNIGSHRLESVILVEILESWLGRKAIKQFLPMQQGDDPATFADVGDLARDIGFAPRAPLETA